MARVLQGRPMLLECMQVKLGDVKASDSLAADDRSENTRVLIKKKSLDRNSRLPLPNGDPSRSGVAARYNLQLSA